MLSPAASTSALPPVESNDTEKISAYYSLAFPNFTYYLQTLNVTIGRRPNPSTTSSSTSSSDVSPVDVDLGPLKNVSRLHARIEYEDEEERFVLVVLGRNGAWVDGIWAGCGSKVPLGQRSQIQIATRTFHFILPPPQEPETISASPPPSTTHGRSPSVDITSLSPASSRPPSPNPIPDASVATENSNPKPSVSKSKMSKKRKRSAIEAPKVPPDKMPPKPLATYTVMCYRAITALGGRATLQDVIQWMIDNYEWYKLNVGGPWENSIRHNLSSNRAFRNVAKSSDERIKGFLWGIDPTSEPALKEQDVKAQQAELGRQKSLTTSPDQPSSLTKGLPPPVKPAFTTEPLKLSRDKFITNGHVNDTGTVARVVPPSPVTLQLSPFPKSSHPAAQPSSSAMSSNTNLIKTEVPTPTIPPSTQLSSSQAQAITTTTNSRHPVTAVQQQALPPNVTLPIIVAPLPESYDSSAAAAALASSPAAAILSSPPIVVHEGTLILNPTVFSHLTPEQLKELEQMGAQKALEALQADVVRFLKAKMKSESGSRGRGRGRVRGRGRGGHSTRRPSLTKPANGPQTDLIPTTVTAVESGNTTASTNGHAEQKCDDTTIEERPMKRMKLELEEADGDIDIVGT